MAPKSPEKAKKESPNKAAAAEEEKKSPVKAGAGSAGKTRAASPTKLEKSPAKKPKGEEALAEGPAAHTRAKEGDAPTSAAAKAAANAAAANLLPELTITDVLLADHRDTVALLKHFEEIAGGQDKLMMEKLVDAIAITIRLHSQAEADVLYPLLAKRLGAQGKEAMKHAASEHAKIERDLVTALEQRKSGSEELASTLKEVMEAFIHHMKEEEEEMVPKLLAGMSEEEQVEVCQSFLSAKAKAPLEPQPEAAEEMAAA
ncbi:hypothetical protein ABPG75_007817 [Micractinium tetrahymenae]